MNALTTTLAAPSAEESDSPTLPDTRRRYKPAETRQNILDAARTLFRQHGYLKTSTSDIAAAAGVAEGSIFYHYGSKQNVLAELGKLYAAEMIANMRGDSVDLTDLEPGIMIERAFRHKLCPTGMLTGSYESEVGLRITDSELQPFMNAARSACVDFIETVMHATIGKRTHNSINIPVAASIAFAAVDSAMHRILCAQEENAQDAGPIIAECIRFVRAALGYTPDGRDQASF
jgi:AcrR family transcriptional regulator